MSDRITRTELLTALGGHMPDVVAEGRLQEALAQAGLADQPDYAPDEVAVLGRAMLALANGALDPALPELEEIPGPLLAEF